MFVMYTCNTWSCGLVAGARGLRPVRARACMSVLKHSLCAVRLPLLQVLEGADLFEDALYWHEVESEDGEGHEHPSADTDKPANTLAYLNA